MTVITSKEQKPYLLAWEKYRETAEIEVMSDVVLWKFKTRDEADNAAKVFFGLGFEDIRRADG